MANDTREVFLAALGLGDGARQRYLDGACQGRPELRQRIGDLLTAYGQAESFLEQPPGATDTGLIEGPGSLIGRYRLVEEIGEGGFGRVFMAQQLEPVRRRVALKIIKAGMDTRQVVARFEAERQALALMDHPGIARVLDGGVTDTGRPYFVMELVNGIPITSYCDRYQIGATGRLELFLKVCRAVQHAHQKGVIHRDLKPTNILVTLIDGEPIPKIIDFGVAKALGHKLTEATVLTGFQQLIGTPAYMSPEQAELSGIDVDTRSDIYSLGVLLYELLTGVTPFEKPALKAASVEEVRRLVCEREPIRPSTRLRGLGPPCTDIARRRQSEPAALLRLLRGELDWIVMRCLERDRARRYEAVTALAQDIENYLEHRPIAAGPPSKVYRLRKFVRRHRHAALVTALVMLSLIAGLVLATTGLVRATRERNRAIAAERRADQAGRNARGIVELLKQLEWRPLNELRHLLQVQGRSSAEVDRFCQQALLDKITNSKIPSLAYHLRVRTTGQYRLWLRWNAPDTRSDSVLAQIVELQDGPGGLWPDVYGFLHAADGTDFTAAPVWHAEAQREDLYPGSTFEPAAWTIEKPGDYTLRFLMTEAGVALDAFVFQLVNLPPPTGAGPPESAVASDGAVVEHDGRFVIEAEHPSARTAGLSNCWVAIPQEHPGDLLYRNYRGSGYVQAFSSAPAR